MRRLDTIGFDMGGDRLDTLALSWEDQACALRAKRGYPIDMPQGSMRLHERGKPTLTPAIDGVSIHGPPPYRARIGCVPHSVHL